MDNDTTKLITRMQTTQENIVKELIEVKEEIKDLKKCIPSLEAHSNLDERVTKIEANISKITWMVISAVVGAVLLLVLRT